MHCRGDSARITASLLFMVHFVFSAFPSNGPVTLNGPPASACVGRAKVEDARSGTIKLERSIGASYKVLPAVFLTNSDKFLNSCSLKLSFWPDVPGIKLWLPKEIVFELRDAKFLFISFGLSPSAIILLLKEIRSPGLISSGR